MSNDCLSQDRTLYGYDDAHGYMTQLPHLSQMDYNFKDELITTSRQQVNEDDEVDNQTQLPQEYVVYQYDASGMRTRKVCYGQNGKIKYERRYLGSTEEYYQDSGQYAGLVRHSLHINDGEQRVALYEQRNDIDDDSPVQTMRYQIANHQPSSTLELDDEANLISYESYHPFGTTAYQANNKDIKAAAKRYRYSGKERDEETGLYYFGARYYMPWLGRWTSCDPIVFSEGQYAEAELNGYQYVDNDPVGGVDPSGENEAVVNRGLIIDLPKGAGSGAAQGVKVGAKAALRAVPYVGTVITVMEIAKYIDDNTTNVNDPSGLSLRDRIGMEEHLGKLPPSEAQTIDTAIPGSEPSGGFEPLPGTRPAEPIDTTETNIPVEIDTSIPGRNAVETKPEDSIMLSEQSGNISKNAELLRTGGKNTAVNVKTKKEANDLLNEAFPDYQKVRGIGPQDAAGIRKKRKMDRFKQGGTYHKDYAVDPDTGRVRGHGANDAHGEFPHINIKRNDGTKVIINITGGN